MSLNAIIIRHPSLYLLSAPVIGAVALSPAPSFAPIILLLSILNLQLYTIIPRGKLLHGGAQVLLLSLAGSLAHQKASFNALSTPAISIIVLAALLCLTSIISLFIIFTSYYASRAVKTPWAKLTIFPALWVTVWGSIAYVSPVGRLLTWSPVAGLGPYEWIRPIFGQWGVDWLVAAWAVVCAEIIGNWLIGPAGGDLDAALEQEQIVLFESEDVPNLTQLTPNVTARPSISARSRDAFILVALLVILTLPSIFLSPFPAPPLSAATTPLPVGCVLPYPQRSGEITGAPTLNDYISESAVLQSRSSIVIWPESAVRFESAQEKEEAFERIRGGMQDKKLWGVSYEEFVLPDQSDGQRRPVVKKNGFALLEKGVERPVLEYSKRMLVPIAESFSLQRSYDPPEVVTWDLQKPKDWSKTRWGTNGTRPIPLTASICLDFSSSFSFNSFDTRPALILAPARTWHIGVGNAMWEQAKARAEELGSMVLWCDGGEGGVSGIAGGGMQDFVQVGRGSWVRTIGIQYPFDQGRTFFAVGGAYAALATAWGVTGIGVVLEMILMSLAGPVTGLAVLREKIRAWRVRNQPDEERPLLISVD